MRRLVVVIAVVLAGVAAAAPAARAGCKDIRWETRWQPDPFGTSGGSLIRVPVCHDGAPSTGPRRTRPDEPTRRQLRKLRFVPSEAVSARVRNRMIEQLAWGEQAEQARAAIASGDLMRQYHAAVEDMGWSTRDLGDMYALAYLQQWLIVNGRHRTSAAVDRAVRKDLRRQLALDRSVRGASDAEQQETAEYLGSWTVAIGGTYTALKDIGDPARLAAFRDRARELADRPDLLDVDLTKVRLTRKGIVRR